MVAIDVHEDLLGIDAQDGDHRYIPTLIIVDVLLVRRFVPPVALRACDEFCRLTVLLNGYDDRRMVEVPYPRKVSVGITHSLYGTAPRPPAAPTRQ